MCAIAVKRSLAGVEGVKEVDVSFKEKKAWLTADESVTDEVLELSVEKSGYRGKVILREQVEEEYNPGFEEKKD